MTDSPHILVLTPVKNATSYVDSYFAGLKHLDYPQSRISIGMLESDSTDDTFAVFGQRLAALGGCYASVGIWKKDFNFRFPSGLPRWTHEYQIPRRAVLARARNHLLFHALADQDWVLWLDVDVIEYPADLIRHLLKTGRDIVHPHCVTSYGGSTFDLNAWRENGDTRLNLGELRGRSELVRLDAVGGTVLFIRADIHRDGLIFPSFLYGAKSGAIRRTSMLAPGILGEIETEGLGIMATDMGHQCWGMPNLEVLHAPEPPPAADRP